MPDSRLAHRFADRAGATGLIPFFTAGYPSLDATLELLRAAEPSCLAVELGIPFPYVMALVVASIEFGGGVCLILGLGTRMAALAEAVIMANAIWTVQLKDVKSFSELLFLSEFLSIGIFVWLAFTGAGKMSLDYWLVRKLRGSAQPR